MLVDFSVQNFESIKERQTLSLVADSGNKDLKDYYTFKVGDLRLLKMIMIYGSNASGKTTVLKALKFLRDLIIKPNEKKQDEFDYDPFLFDKKTPLQNTEFEINFIVNAYQYNYRVVLNKKYIVSEELRRGRIFSDGALGKRAQLVVSRTTDVEKQLASVEFNDKLNVSEQVKEALGLQTLWNSSVLAAFSKINSDIEPLRDASEWFQEYLIAFITPKVKLTQFVTGEIDRGRIEPNKLLQFLKKADLHISDINLTKEDAKIPKKILDMILKDDNLPEGAKKEIETKQTFTQLELNLEHQTAQGTYSLPFKKESRGTDRYYGLAGILYLLLKNNCLFCIDELEASLHPDLFLHFIATFLYNSKHNSQCIVTTHNREILDNRDLFRDDAIWFTDKGEDCATELYSLADFDTSTIRKSNNVLNFLKAGRLGGVPNLGDLYIDLDDEEATDE